MASFLKTRPRSQGMRKELVTGVLVLVGLVMVYPALKALPSMASHIHVPTLTMPTAKVASPSPSGGEASAMPASTTPTTLLGPSPLQGSLSCPGPGQGWTATFVWPAGREVSGAGEVLVAPTQQGPWTVRSTTMGVGPFAVKGFRSGTSEWLKAGDSVSMILGQAPVTEGEVVVPPGC